MPQKHCSRCDTTKDLSEFNSNTRRPDGRSHYCTACERTRMREYYLTNPPGDQRRNQFLEALYEIRDQDVYEEVSALIEDVASLLMKRGNLKEEGARNQALDFVAACVSKGATAKRPLVLRGRHDL